MPGIDLLKQIKTAVSVPMFWNGALRGALSLAFFSMRPVEREDIETLEAIASLAAVACRNAEAFEEATEAARTDSLTGLLNHGAIQMRTSEEIWRSQRAERPFACLLCRPRQLQAHQRPPRAPGRRRDPEARGDGDRGGVPALRRHRPLRRRRVRGDPARLGRGRRPGGGRAAARLRGPGGRATSRTWACR